MDGPRGPRLAGRQAPSKDAKLAPHDVAAWLRRHQKNGASARTTRYARSVLRAALNQALRWELVLRNAAALTDPPRYRAREIQPLTPDQARTLLEVVAGHRLEALISVGLGLGLRRGEALGLRWDAVNLRPASCRCVRLWSGPGGDPEAVRTTVRFAEPKTNRSRRTITIPGLVTDALRAHRLRQLEERLAAGARWRESGLVFTSTVGTPLDERNLNRLFKAILRDANLPAIRYHDLRHTAATLLLAQGVDPRTIHSLHA